MSTADARAIVELVAREAERLGVAIDVAALEQRVGDAADALAAGEEGAERLGDTGAVLVTDAAVRGYLGRRERSRDELEHARRELLALAHHARAVDATLAPEQWRSRARAVGLDVTIRVAREAVLDGLPPLAVVVASSRPRRRR